MIIFTWQYVVFTFSCVVPVQHSSAQTEGKWFGCRVYDSVIDGRCLNSALEMSAYTNSSVYSSRLVLCLNTEAIVKQTYNTKP